MTNTSVSKHPHTPSSGAQKLIDLNACYNKGLKSSTGDSVVYDTSHSRKSTNTASTTNQTNNTSSNTGAVSSSHSNSANHSHKHSGSGSNANNALNSSMNNPNNANFNKTQYNTYINTHHPIPIQNHVQNYNMNITTPSNYIHSNNNSPVMTNQILPAVHKPKYKNTTHIRIGGKYILCDFFIIFMSRKTEN